VITIDDYPIFTEEFFRELLRIHTSWNLYSIDGILGDEMPATSAEYGLVVNFFAALTHQYSNRGYVHRLVNHYEG
jgi:hypothetical protein